MNFPLFSNKSDKLTILCLGAHCDDIEIGCGGTLRQLLRYYPEARVHWEVFSQGSPQRAQEARASAAAYLADTPHEVMIGEFRDGYLPFDGERVKDRFEELKKLINFDLIFTHARADLHQDHRLLASLTWNTWRNHLILEYEIPKWDGDLGQPNFFVPVPADDARQKVEMLLRHYPSQRQRQWFHAEVFFSLMRLRGLECNAAYAEAFYARKIKLNLFEERADAANDQAAVHAAGPPSPIF